MRAGGWKVPMNFMNGWCIMFWLHWMMGRWMIVVFLMVSVNVDDSVVIFFTVLQLILGSATVGDRFSGEVNYRNLRLHSRMQSVCWKVRVAKSVKTRGQEAIAPPSPHREPELPPPLMTRLSQSIHWKAVMMWKVLVMLVQRYC